LPRAGGDELGAKRWYRQAKNTKRGEMDGKESQRPIRAVKPGNGPPDPVEQRGRRVVDRELEPRRGRRASPACHRETAQSCEGQRFRNVTNRMPLTGTSGSVGAPGSNPWRYPARNSRPSVPMIVGPRLQARVGALTQGKVTPSFAWNSGLRRANSCLQRRARPSAE
jgi:hypothetical protein